MTVIVALSAKTAEDKLYLVGEHAIIWYFSNQNTSGSLLMATTPNRSAWRKIDELMRNISTILWCRYDRQLSMSFIPLSMLHGMHDGKRLSARSLSGLLSLPVETIIVRPLRSFENTDWR